MSHERMGGSKWRERTKWEIKKSGKKKKKERGG
jgi:hypothetical protein